VRIVGHFLGIESQPYQALLRQFRRPVRAPATQQIENHAVRRQSLGKELLDRIDSGVVDVDDLAREVVELGVRGFIDALKMLGSKRLLHRLCPSA
jgi:hypothetical protein